MVPAKREQITKAREEKLTKFALALIGNNMKLGAAAKAVGIKRHAARWANYAMKSDIVNEVLMEYRIKAIREFGVTPMDLIKKHAEIVSAQITDYYNENGDVLPMKDWKNPQAVYAYHKKPTRFGIETKITLFSKPKSLEALGQHINFYSSHETAKKPIMINLENLNVEEMKAIILAAENEKSNPNGVPDR